MPKAPHHRGDHQVRARRVTDQANRNTATRCCECGNTLDQCGPRGDGRNGNGTPCTWDAGHPDGRWTGRELRAECSWCNRSRGATAGNLARRAGYDWP
jgi:hypothetical protein